MRDDALHFPFGPDDSPSKPRVVSAAIPRADDGGYARSCATGAACSHLGVRHHAQGSGSAPTWCFQEHGRGWERWEDGHIECECEGWFGLR